MRNKLIGLFNKDNQMTIKENICILMYKNGKTKLPGGALRYKETYR